MSIDSVPPAPNGKSVNGTHGGHCSSPGIHNRPLPAGVAPVPIAICGIGLRLPGGIRTGDDFWNLLINNGDARSEIPASRFAIDGFDGSLGGGGNGAIHTRHGYFLEEDLSRLDASFFSMTKREIERCDPQQRLLLEVVRECLEDAGEVNYRGKPVGCYVGTFGGDWHVMTMRDVQHMGNYSMAGVGDLMIANRVSYEFDLRGPR
jgi:acyl transferase domain-containing protein